MRLANFSVNSGDGQDFIYRVNKNPEVQKCLDQIGRPSHGLLEAIMDPVDHSAGIGLGLAAMDRECQGVLATSAKYEPLGRLWGTNVLALARGQQLTTRFHISNISRHTEDDVIPIGIINGHIQL
jgi:hypothetical protein